MRVLVIGGNGFIGSHLVDRLCGHGFEVTVLDLHARRYDTMPTAVTHVVGDLSDPSVVQQALPGIDVVFHLAWSTIHESSNVDPVADAQANLIPSIQLLAACCRAGVGRVVYASSGGTVYGIPSDLPLTETSQQQPITAYGVSKLAVEKYLEMYRQLYGLDYVVLRPSVPYGPRQSPLARQGAIAVFLHRVARGLPVSIWGDGNTTRDFFYVSDLVEALMASMMTRSAHRVFNIGGGEEISLLELVRLVEQNVRRSARLEFVAARPFDVPRLLLDIRRAQSELNWRPTVPLALGVQKTWDWIQQHFAL